MKHAPAFLKIVDDAKTRIRETNAQEVKQRLDAKESFTLMDVREESEWAKGHLPGSQAGKQDRGLDQICSCHTTPHFRRSSHSAARIRISSRNSAGISQISRLSWPEIPASEIAISSPSRFALEGV